MINENAFDVVKWDRYIEELKEGAALVTDGQIGRARKLIELSYATVQESSGFMPNMQSVHSEHGECLPVEWEGESFNFGFEIGVEGVVRWTFTAFDEDQIISGEWDFDASPEIPVNAKDKLVIMGRNPASEPNSMTPIR